MERDLAARRDAEIKQGQAHHHDEVLRIQEAIRKAEQVQLAPTSFSLKMEIRLEEMLR